MSTSAHFVLYNFERYGRLWWLPSGGYDNGLDAESWAPILDVDARAAMILLNALREAEVPAYTAALRTVSHPPGRHSSRTRGWPAYRLWVGSRAHARAEQVLMSTLPGLVRQWGAGVVR